MRTRWIAGLLALLAPAQARPQDDPAELTLEVFGGADVVPPDVVESGIAQDRIEGVLGANALVTYSIGDTRIVVGAGTEIYPVDGRFDRHTIGAALRHDIRLSSDGRTSLRLGAGYDYVFGEDGRVFDRVEGEVQLIRRHSREHATTARIRYGYRNQSEERFTGFDQDELLVELRHNWRPGGGRAAFNGSLIWLEHDAEAERFSYSGYGARLTGRFEFSDNLALYGRASWVVRDYKAPFSAQFPVEREDERIQLSAGVEAGVAPGLQLFGEAGYVGNPSNIPVRDFSGVTGRGGLRAAL
ncbi:hypothetical protein [Alteraurantiacibacter aquimixticola]|uniref:DUF481 domain-containing protein n=1 Tax=Alteraurantiacibacter aquimixticola TaxID=2489173 RepID=A0A4T3F757_9SPHN|nr:hypothetical protein [Alteraurantiacibacter aquimixticola]TIX50696.1 hypothetical protein E5222_10630 [Alteraurantiacibacter aquimixticola]